MAEQILDFPKFPNGDVTIHLSLSKRYRLHSNILRQNSPVLAHLIDEKPAARLSAQARREDATPYVLELYREGLAGPGHFIRMDISENSGRVKGSTLQPGSNTGSSVHDPYRFWDWLFGAFYKIPPKFDDDNLATIVTSVMGLADHAEVLGSIEHVREFLELSLIRQDKTLWRAVLGSPWVWASLAERISSPNIYQECVCHLVGRWQSLNEQFKRSLTPHTRELCQEKYRELYVAKEAIEMRILGHYPNWICYNVDDKPGRPQYSSDIYMWMCLTFFRHWFAQSISEDRTRRAVDGGYKFFKAIWEGGDAYLKHVDFQNFHQYFPMSAKACSVLEQNMTMLKEDVKQFVQEIMANNSHVKPGENGVPENGINWLTCVTVTKEEFPWYKGDEFPAEPNGDLFRSPPPEANGLRDMDNDGHPISTNELFS